jgi:response regulator RpfG family c-di-GMP phosphodiesterase
MIYLYDRSRQEDLVAEVHKELEARERAQSDLNRTDKEPNSELRREHRSMEAKESALQSALNNLAWTQSFLMQREADLASAQFSLQGVESESKWLG